MSDDDVVVRRLDDFESNHDVYYRVRAGLGVTSFGIAVERWPGGSDMYPEHDESRTGQEEVYYVLSGSGVLRTQAQDVGLEAGMFVRIGPAVRRKVVPGVDGIELLCIGGVPGGVYEPPRFTQAGAPFSDPG